MAEQKLKSPSVLAFEAKLLPSDGVMTCGQWDAMNDSANWPAVTVESKSVRGTISNRPKTSKANDPAKLDAEVSKPNLQTVDFAALPFDCDTLKLHFTLRVLGDLATPSTCNNQDYQEALATIINTYIEEHGFGTLSYRYATNLLNGRFLWRNRPAAEAVHICVQHEGTRWEVNAMDYSTRHFDHGQEELSAIARVFEQGLSGEKNTLFAIHAFAKMGEGQAVYPSQELIMNTGKTDKSKTLYQLDGVAAMHSQKLGNAIRTIDTWYPAADTAGPIAVEPYGSVTNRGIAYRQPKAKDDFYNLFDAWVLKGKKPDVEQQHYIMAMLIRGGVFGE